MFVHRTWVATPNDPKLSDSPGWRDRCAAGERRRQEAAGVTAGRVRCSAWLGVIPLLSEAEGTARLVVIVSLAIAFIAVLLAVFRERKCRARLAAASVEPSLARCWQRYLQNPRRSNRNGHSSGEDRCPNSSATSPQPSRCENAPGTNSTTTQNTDRK